MLQHRPSRLEEYPLQFAPCIPCVIIFIDLKVNHDFDTFQSISPRYFFELFAKYFQWIFVIFVDFKGQIDSF